MPPYDVSSSTSTSVTYSPPLSQPLPHHRLADPSRLDPSRLDPSIYSPPRRPRDSSTSLNALRLQDATNSSLRPPSAHRTRKPRIRSSSRRRKPPVWRKLLWVKQSYPDNYTDAATFLDHLQRNPRLQPYEFWQLVGEATVIVQHVAAVAVFACCFVGIYAERASPVAVVGAGSVGTVVGWVIWDGWVGKEEEAAAAAALREAATKKSVVVDGGGGDAAEDGSSTSSGNGELAGNVADAAPRQSLSHSASATSVNSLANGTSHPTGAPSFPAYSYHPPYGDPVSSISPRNQQRLATAKSAVLIYCALLGLSPILKSLTKSTTSDSIWAMSCWLMCINVFFFDYGGSVGAKFPASLSTNAALMASTVLASRLDSTTSVFSLLLFSIEVFGLFPVFRRHLRHVSWQGHVTLTILLVMAASGGVGVTISGGGWTAAVVGMVLGSILTGLSMGICSWWLIGLQKYKNEIYGPWDPARPVIRRRWD
ncbi:hypothetical protein W97_05653 [Coniosporium apollinis CBS 100218]|uniref:Phosphatidylinositol glycan, class C n=1 Tax=Coniosporium apollinis (strain CBS 100218) TaxID=1168221 RepID=R7YWE4_CONA1|nr:uncharacterized protein W97_05653 [Coniosporium apollinis CBS 100218]EON66260.1 hypothetical protein W97_05653 [Coniosporium apollinis CBS 100218]